MKKTSDLREFARYTVPNVLGMVGLSCYILADTFFVSKGMGSDGLAALNLAIPVYSFIHGTGLMLGMGGATRYAILKSQGNSDQAQQTFTHALGLAGIFALFFFLCGLAGSDAITRFLGADAQVYGMTRTYLRVLLLFSPLFLLNDTLLPFIRNDGAPRLAMCGLMVSSFSHIVLDYIFNFPLNMGIFGAVFATSIAPLLSLAVFSPYFWKGHNGFRLVRCPVHPHTVKTIFALGLPSLVTEVSAGIVMIVFNGILLSLQGNLAVASYGVVSNLALVVTSIYTGVAQGSQPLLSRRYGAGEHSRAAQLLRYAVCTVSLLSVLIYAFVFLGAEAIAAVFNRAGDLQLQSMAVQGLRVYFTCCPFIGLNVMLSTYFTSTEHSRPANVISILRGLVLVVPMAFLLARLGGMRGLWCAVTLTELLTALASTAFYLKMRKKGPV